MQDRPRVAVSACLLGRAVRYDGGHKRCDWVTSVLAKEAELVAVCPEVEMGLGVPRPKVHRVEDGLRVIGGAAVISAAETCERLLGDPLGGVAGAILKSRSPSCGLAVELFAGDGQPSIGTTRGLFAAALLRRWPDLPTLEEADLPEGGEEFLRRVRAYHARASR